MVDAILVGAVPCPLGKGRYARHDSFRHLCRNPDFSPVVKNPDHVSLLNVPYLGVHCVNGNGLADPAEIYDSKEQAVNAVALENYPSPPARNLNLVTKGPPSGLVQTFLIWILTDGQQYVDESGYIPLSPELLAHELGKLIQ